MTAYDLLSAGLSVLPIDPRTKRPPVKGSETYPESTQTYGYPWKGSQKHPPNEAAVRAFLKRFPGCWLGFACGEGSGGIEVLDFDIPNKRSLPQGTKGEAPAWEPWCAKVREAGLGALLDGLTIVETQSGGRQVYYRCPNPGGNSKLASRRPSEEELKADPRAKAKDLIETRGVGGLVVCPPSPGYRFVQGGIGTIPTIADEERGALWAIACSLDETPPPEPAASTPRRDRVESDLRPGDDFEARATWDEILDPHGYRRVGRSYSGMQLWAHPDKAKGDHSARAGRGKEGDRFFSWSSNGGVPANQLLTKFALYAYLNHGGDFDAAARDLGSKNYGSPPRRPRTEAATAERPAQKDMDEDETITDPIDIQPRNFALTDVGNARRLVHHYGTELRYCSDWGRWLTYDKVRWAEDSQDNRAARGMAQSLTDIMRDDPDEAIQKHGTRSQESAKISALLREAQVSLGVRAGDMDRHDHLLAFKNGVVDLRTAEIVDNPRDLLITKQCNTYWDPDARCNTFDHFLAQVTKERSGLMNALVRALGYSLTGSTQEHKFFLMYGPRARNGKSTLQELLDEILGADLCGAINKKLLTDSGRDSARFAVASLEGKRIVHANENSKGRSFDTEFLKEFSGGTKMMAEKKGKDEFKIDIKAKLWMSVNNMPSADWSDAYGARVFPFPFEQSFYNQDNPLYQPGDLPDDKLLKAKLRAEAPGIMARLVRNGSVPWYREGLVVPAEVAALIESYRVENDHIGQWIAERCVAGPEHRATMGAAFIDFKKFVKESSLPWHGRINEFSEAVRNRPGLALVRPKNKSTIVGIGLRSEFDKAWEGAGYE